MPSLLEDVATTPAVDTTVPSVDPGEHAKVGDDPFAGAGAILFGDPDKPADNKMVEDKPTETPEAKAVREAAEAAAAETPDQKAAREAAETPEQKAERVAKEAKAAEDAKAKAAGAPDKYEAFTVPEGKEIAPEVLTQFQTLAKEANLPQAAAQKFVDMVATMGDRWATQQAAAIATAQSEWTTSAKADPEFGGVKLAESLGIAQKAVKQFGTPELNAILNDGLGNHPEVIRLFYRIGKSISEAAIVNGGQPSATSAEKVLYPNLK